ncbi:MAG TPA: tRNA (N6-isopentenyl adenosine(37)-C2)-methylthiotransferase MiaB [Thermoanaerobaculia bacterium]|nr:tRNA (N6-isopentenyl adenosine(37)-C2)-methylthiotransferase MiaB [Thermoanaerobaculia bacterium]
MSTLPAYSASHSEQEGCASSYRIETWGCQMNVLDSARIAGQLDARGMRPAGDGEEPDVVVLNTCSVREKAESKVYSALGVLARRKREHPDMVIGVSGCVAQVSGDEILERAPYVDFVLGTGQVERAGEIVEQIRSERRRVTALDLPKDSPVYQFRQISRGSSFQAYVTVIEGCDQFCTFCIVPFTRGRERSRRSAEIVEEVESLTRRGFGEVMLLGQTVNAYADPTEGFGLGELLTRVARVPGLRRLRFITSHPALVDEVLVEALGSSPNIAPYMHLPAQSGSDRVLYRMKRRYGRADYAAVVRRLRARVPEIAISSDFIVGFPGESEQDFEETLSLIRETRFANVFAFRYSPRPGTASARWGSAQEIAEPVASERLARLLALQAEIQAEINRALEGRTFEVLIENRDRKGQSRGRTACNRVVHVEDGDDLKPGEYAWVRIVKGLPNSLISRVETAGRRTA